MYDTLVRALDYISTRNIDEESMFGLIGEQNFAQIVASDYVRANPIVPHPGRFAKPHLADQYPEVDFLLYTRGVLFCIEIKRWKGAVRYVSGCGSHQRCPVRGNGKPCEHPTERCLQQTKRSGETRYYRSPLDKRTFIQGLKKYLARPDIFDAMPITVIALFDKEANIDQIVRGDGPGGRIAGFREYAELFARHGLTDDLSCPDAIRAQLDRLPTWDWVYNYHGDTAPMKGILAGTRLQVMVDGNIVAVPYREIQTIKINKRDGQNNYMTLYRVNGDVVEVGRVDAAAKVVLKQHRNRPASQRPRAPFT